MSSENECPLRLDRDAGPFIDQSISSHKDVASNADWEITRSEAPFEHVQHPFTNAEQPADDETSIDEQRGCTAVSGKSDALTGCGLRRTNAIRNFGSTEIPDDEPAQGVPNGELAFISESTDRFNYREVFRHAALWPGLFKTWDGKLRALVVSYEVMLHLMRFGNDAVDEIMKYPPFSKLDRKPSRKNLAVLALRLVTKPCEKSEHQAVSEYAAMLNWALAERIRPEDFIKRGAMMTLRECRDFLRERTGKTTPKQRHSTRDQKRGPTLFLRLPDGGERRIALRLEPHEEEALLTLANKAEITAAELAEAIGQAAA